MYDAISAIAGYAGGAVAVIGTGAAIWQTRQLGKVVKEITDVVTAYRTAKSDGKITPKEMDNIITEIEEAVRSVVAIWRR